MIDARLPWLAASSSRNELEAGSSTSVLQSIYGSQVSQLQFTDSDSEASLLVVEDEVQIRRQLRRPKSSPASALLRREQPQQRALPRPGSALTHLNLPQRTFGPHKRQMQRPSSAMPSSSRHRPATGRRRPGTAAGTRQVRPSSASPVNSLGSSTSLTQLPTLRETAPVGLSSTPQYFGFWAEKPLLRKEHVVPVHQRMGWRRPQSGRGLHSQLRAGKGSSVGRDGVTGLNNEGSQLSTLDEIDSVDGSLHGRKMQSNGHSGDGTEGEGGGEECGVEQIAGNELDQAGYREGSGSGDSEDGGEVDKLWGQRRASESGCSLAVTEEELTHEARNRDKGKWAGRGGTYSEDGDEYFNKVKMQPDSAWLDSSIGGSSITHFRLPVDLQTFERMAPADYLRLYCSISHTRSSHYAKVFSQHVRDKDRRIAVKDLLEGLVEVHHHCLSPDQAYSVVELMQLEEGTRVDQKLFGAACVLAERVFPKCLPHALSKDVIEVADFQGLDWKLRNCSISQSLDILLAHL